VAEKQASQVPWYSEEAGFFGPGYLRKHVDDLTQERTLAEVDFLEKMLPLQKGSKILDCPCGHGRHSIELARRGYNVTGHDLSGFFLGEAEKASRDAGVSVRWNKGDMREIPFENEFDVAFNLFTAFGYLENDDEDQKALNAIAKALKPGGKFVLDVVHRDGIIRIYREKDWQRVSDGSIVIVDRQFDQATGRNIEKQVWIWNNGKREEFSIIVRMYTVSELAAMFRRAGLALYETYGSYGGDSLTLDSKRSILFSKKN
jgi:ubiquinone/menaquinone biosynthesis C-methylase UbiE